MPKAKKHQCSWPAEECASCRYNCLKQIRYYEDAAARQHRVSVSRAYRHANADTVRQKDRQRDTPARRKAAREANTRTYHRELDKARAYGRAKYHRNKHRGTYTANTAKRRAQALQATPAWLTQAHKAQIKIIYEAREHFSQEMGSEWHVDHVVPLQGKDVCGLHVPWNLQVLPAAANLSKANKLSVEAKDQLAWTPANSAS